MTCPGSKVLVTLLVKRTYASLLYDKVAGRVRKDGVAVLTQSASVTLRLHPVPQALA